MSIQRLGDIEEPLLSLDQVAVIEIWQEKGVAKIRKGVRQGCLITGNVWPFAKDAMKQLKKISSTGDKALLGENDNVLEEYLLEMTSIIRDYNMKINKRKTRYTWDAKNITYIR